MNGLYYGDNLNIRRWYGGNPRGSKGAQAAHHPTRSPSLPVGFPPQVARRSIGTATSTLFSKTRAGLKPIRESGFPRTRGIGKGQFRASRRIHARRRSIHLGRYPSSSEAKYFKTEWIRVKGCNVIERTDGPLRGRLILHQAFGTV